MAWDTARTKQLLLDAAVEEFAEHGPEGARVARVATRAGVNKERIYQYFGSKEKLFVAVLEAELAKLATAVPMTPEQAEDLGDYAGRTYDYHREHPHFLRLLAWEGLMCQDRVVAECERTDHYAEKIAAITEAQRRGALTAEVPAAQLLHSLVSLISAWFTLPQLARILVPEALDAGEGSGGGDPRRAALVATAHRLTRP